MPEKSAGGRAPAKRESFAPLAEKPAGGEAPAADADDKATDHTIEEQFAKFTVVADSDITSEYTDTQAVGSASASAVGSASSTKPKTKKNTAARKLARAKNADAKRAQALHKWNSEIDDQKWIPQRLDDDSEDMFNLWCALDCDWIELRSKLMCDRPPHTMRLLD